MAPEASGFVAPEASGASTLSFC